MRYHAFHICRAFLAVLCFGMCTIWHNSMVLYRTPKSICSDSKRPENLKPLNALRIDVPSDQHGIRSLDEMYCTHKSGEESGDPCPFQCEGRFQVGTDPDFVFGSIESIERHSYSSVSHRGLILLDDLLGLGLLANSRRAIIPLQEIEPYTERLFLNQKCWSTRTGDRIPVILTLKNSTENTSANTSGRLGSYEGSRKQLAYTLLYLYIANCDSNSTARLLSGEFTWFDIDCFKAEEWEGKNSGRIADKLYDQDTLCHLPMELIRRLERANEPTSFVSSIGVQLKRATEAEGLHPLDELHHSIYRELDGRVSYITGQYMSQCILSSRKKNQINQLPFDLLLREAYKPVTHFKRAARTPPSFWGKLANRFTVHLKTFTTQTVSLRWRNQGLAELVAYYVDRIIGMYRVPATFHTFINFTTVLISDNIEVLTTSIKDHAKSNHSEYTCNKTKCSEEITSTMEQMVYDKASDSVGINVAYNGFFKELYELVAFDDMKDFLLRTNTSMLPSIARRQQLLDIADIILIDYLMHQVDRYDQEYFCNWGTSEGRYFAFDMGLSSIPSMNTSNCKTLLNCPPILCKVVHRPLDSFQFTFTCELNGDQDLDTRFCWFNRNTIRNLERVSSRAPQQDRINVTLQDLLQLEGYGGSEINNGYFGKFDIFKSIQERVDYVLEYVNLCQKKYGNVFL